MEKEDESQHVLTDEQAEEVQRRRADFAAGRERYATNEEMAALWKKCGLWGCYGRGTVTRWQDAATLDVKPSRNSA